MTHEEIMKRGHALTAKMRAILRAELLELDAKSPPVDHKDRTAVVMAALGTVATQLIVGLAEDAAGAENFAHNYVETLLTGVAMSVTMEKMTHLRGNCLVGSWRPGGWNVCPKEAENAT